jgi:hypothetical protein
MPGSEETGREAAAPAWVLPFKTIRWLLDIKWAGSGLPVVLRNSRIGLAIKSIGEEEGSS